MPFISEIIAYLGRVAKQVGERDYATDGSNLAMQLIAIENIVKTSDVKNISKEMIKPIQSLLQQSRRRP